jgi:hypothetical protein
MYQSMSRREHSEPSADTKPVIKETVSADASQYPSIIRTKDGRTYQCQIIKRNEATLFLALPQGHFSIPRSVVSSVEAAPRAEPEEVETVEESSSPETTFTVIDKDQ